MQEDDSVIPSDYEPLYAPYDEQGFVTSFDAFDSQIVPFFDKYGFVVIRDAVPMRGVDNCHKELWDTLSSRGKSPTTSQGFDATFDWMRNCYETDYNEKHGFVGNDATCGPSSLAVRQSSAIYHAFSKILGRSDLWCKPGRFGFMRPTRNVSVVNEDGTATKKDMDEWHTLDNFVHWDCNPWTEAEFARVQGVFALTEHNKSSGGFHCLPGFHKHMSEWASLNKHKYREKSLINFDNNAILTCMQRILMRKGSFVVWDSRLPHGNWPNNDDKGRYVMYLTYFPIPKVEHYKDIPSFPKSTKALFALRREYMSAILYEQNALQDMTAHGRRLCGFEPYEEITYSERRVCDISAWNLQQNDLNSMLFFGDVPTYTFAWKRLFVYSFADANARTCVESDALY